MAAHTPDEAVRENDVPPTCKQEGSYDEVVYCSACDVEISRTPKSIGKLTTHTPKEVVRENVVEPTFTADGSYDEVVYCSVCD